MPTATRKCRLCKTRDRVENMVCVNGGWFHSLEEAIEYGREKGKRLQKKQHTKQKREFYENDIKTRREAAVREFNKYIRLRDQGLACISCGAPPGTYKLTAGHFITAGSCSALRFDERNCHGQCWWNCNRNKSGNITGYRLGILERFGEKEGNKILEYLEGPQPTINITVDWYRGIEETYKAKCKELERQAA